jgi:hypothetical protein
MTEDADNELDGVPTLTIDDMLAADDTQFRYIDMRPLGWPGKARIGSLTAEDLIQWTEANDGKAKKTAGLRIIIKSLVDDSGRRIGREEHLNKLANKSHKAIDAIVKEILDLNGLAVKKKEETPTEAAKKD